MITYTVKVDEYKTKYWYLNGNLHREDGPAAEYANGTKFWYLNGKLHREDGPAAECADGTKYWYLNGEQITKKRGFRAMTPEKQRIAIAEACGWTDVRRPIDDSYHTIVTETLEWLMGRVAGVKPSERVHKPLPDYLNDLNAMHEAISALTPNRQEYFVCVLDRMLHGGRASDLSEQFLSLHATAAQRAEAFLKTIGKWEDSQ